jgi:hypothetical protein
MKSWMDNFSDMTMGYIKNIHSPSEAISAFITMSISYAKKHPALILLQGREHGLAYVLELKREFFKRQRNLIGNIIRQGIQSGVFRDINVQKTARIIFSIVRGFYLSIAVEPDSPFCSDKCSELILNGLVKRDKE